MSNPPTPAPTRPYSTMRDVAKLAGVGLKTVSRVINEEPRVSPATVERVLEAAKQLDYRLDVHAGNLKRTDRRARTIGLVVGSVANPFSAAINRGVEDVAAEHGAAVFASSLDDDASRETRIIDEMLGRRVDAMILTTVNHNQSHLVREQERGTVLVFVDRLPIGIAADAVVTNNSAAATQAVEHLLSHGHQRVAYLGDLEHLWTAQQRLAGYTHAIAQAGLRPHAVVQDLHDEAVSEAAVRELLLTADPPTALFTSQNLVTTGAIRALRGLGLQHSVALVGFDDISLADLLEPAVTVLAQNPYRMGREAGETVFARLAGDVSEPRTRVVDSVLIPRGSGEIRPPI